MSLPFALVIAGLVIAGVVLAARAQESAAWRRSLVSFELVWPRTITTEQLRALFTQLAAVTHRPRWSLLPLPPVVFETQGSAGGITHLLRVSRQNKAAVLGALRAMVPGLRLSEVAAAGPQCNFGWELGLTNSARLLAVERAEAMSSALLTSLQPLTGHAVVTLQLIVTSAGTPPAVRTPTAASSQPQLRLPYLLEGETPIDAEAIGQLRKKYEAPLTHAVVRVGVSGVDRRRSQRLLARTWSNFHALNAPGVRLTRRLLPDRLIGARLAGLRLPLLRWPLLLNTRELVGLAAIPTGPVQLPGLQVGAARQLPAPQSMPRRGLVLGVGNYPGQAERPLAVSRVDRTRHSWWVGPTGSGKSNLMASAILQTIASGDGVLAIDVKGDLISEVLARVPPKDEGRVVVLDPTNRSRPTGLQVLQHNGQEAARELAVENTVHIFRELWKGFWGPRTDMVMRAAMSSLTLARTPNGEPYTLLELSPLLTQPAFRRDLLGRTDLPADLRQFWARYEAISEPEKAQWIGPTLNKLDAFTSRSAIRLMLGQSSGLDLTDIFTKRSAVLVPLDKGQLGAETTALLGALVVASLWAATLTRARVPLEQRRPAFAFVDEAQDIVRLPLDMSDLLAQARGYGLGITLSNQYASQLPDRVLKAILGTVRTQLCFALDYDDARLLERRFSPLTADDLQGLRTYEIALRASVGGQTLSPVTGRTLPLPPPTADPRAVADAAALRHGVPRGEVEAAMAARLAAGEQQHRFGREPRT